MKYHVVVEPFALRHFIKSFAKKYPGAWERTYSGLLLEFSLVDLLFQKSIAETILESEEVKICKTEFKIAGTEYSRHSSGNRCIIAVHKDSHRVSVLLVYGKTDIPSHNETMQWKKIVREAYPEYKDIL